MLQTERLYTYFRSRFKLKQGSEGWFYFHNPFDSQKGPPKMHINFTYGWVRDWRSEYSTDVGSFIMLYEGFTSFKEVYELVNSYSESSVLLPVEVPRSRLHTKASFYGKEDLPVIELPKGFVPFYECTSDDSMLVDRGLNYLRKRGISLEYASKKGWGICVDRNENWRDNFYGHIVVPCYVGGDLYHYVGRNIVSSTAPRYKCMSGASKDVMYNEGALYGYDTVYVCEGVFDAATLGDTAVALLGNKLRDSHIQKMLRSVSKDLVFVSDKGFYNKWMRMASGLLDHKRVKVLDLGAYEDANVAGASVVRKVESATEYLSLSKVISDA